MSNQSMSFEEAQALTNQFFNNQRNIALGRTPTPAPTSTPPVPTPPPSSGFSFGEFAPMLAKGLADRAAGAALTIGAPEAAAALSQYGVNALSNLDPETVARIRAVMDAPDFSNLTGDPLDKFVQGAGQLTSAFASDPYAGGQVLLGVLGASLPEFITSGLLATLPGGQGPAAARATAATVAGLSGLEGLLAGQAEYGGTLLDAVRTRLGTDTPDAADIATLLKDEQFMSEIDEKGVPRSFTVGALTAFLGPATTIAARAPSRLSRIGGVSAAQAAQEGAPEAAAQLVTEGAITDPEDVAFQTFVGGLLGLPAGVVSALAVKSDLTPPPDVQDIALEKLTTELDLGPSDAATQQNLTPSPADTGPKLLTYTDSQLETTPSFDIQTGRLENRLNTLSRQQVELNKKLEKKNQTELLQLARASQTPNTIKFDQLTPVDQLRVARRAQQLNKPTPQTLRRGDLESYNLNPDYLRQTSPTQNPELDNLLAEQTAIQQEKAKILNDLRSMRENTRRYGPTFSQLLDNTGLRTDFNNQPIRAPEQLVQSYNAARSRLDEIQQNPSPATASEFRNLNRFVMQAEPVLNSDAFRALQETPPLLAPTSAPTTPDTNTARLEQEIADLNQNIKNISEVLKSDNPEARTQINETARAQGIPATQLRRQLSDARKASQERRTELRRELNTLRRAPNTKNLTPSPPSSVEAPQNLTPSPPQQKKRNTDRQSFEVVTETEPVRTSLSPGNPDIPASNNSEYQKVLAEQETTKQKRVMQRRDGTVDKKGWFFRNFQWATALSSVNNLGHFYQRMADLMDYYQTKKGYATTTVEEAFTRMPTAQKYFRNPKAGQEFNETIGRALEYARLNNLQLRTTEGVIEIPEIGLRLTEEQTQAYKEVQEAMQYVMQRFTDGVLMGINPAFVGKDLDTLIVENPQHTNELAKVKELLSMSQTGRDYVPFTRNGKFSVYATKPDGSDFYRLFPTKKKAQAEYDALVQQLTAEGYTEISPIQEKTDTNALYKKLAGEGRLSIIETMDALLKPENTTDAERRANIEMIFSGIDKEKRSRFINNLKETKYVPGYDKNFAMSILGYFEKMGSAGAAFGYQPGIKARVSDISTTHPELRDVAFNFLTNTADVHDAIKWAHQFAFLNIFGADIGAAALQYVGLPLNVVTQLQAFGFNPGKDTLEVAKLTAQAQKALYSLKLKAMRQNRMGGIDFRSEESLKELSTFLSPDELNLIRNAAEEVSSSTLINSVINDSEDLAPNLDTRLKRNISTIIEKSGVFMRDAEQTMRLATITSAYRKLKDTPVSKIEKVYGQNGFYRNFVEAGLSPAEAAARTFNRTWNPLFGRNEEAAIMGSMGGLVGALAKYQNYPQQIIEGMVRSAVQGGPAGQMSLALQVLAIASAAGLYGIPFAEDLIEGFEAAYRKVTGTEALIEENLIDWAQRQVEEYPSTAFFLGEDGRGLTRGFGRDFLGAYVSERIGLGSTPLTQGVREVFTGEKAPQELGLGSIFGNILKDIDVAVQRGDPLAVAMALTPSAIKDVYKAFVVYPDIGAVSRNGERVYMGPSDATSNEITLAEQSLRAIGFQPAEIQEAMQAQFALSTMKNFATEYNRRIRNAYQLAVRDEYLARRRNDPSALAQALEKQKQIMQDTTAFNQRAKAPWQRINPDWSALRREGLYLAIEGPNYQNIPRDLRLEAMRRNIQD